MGLKLVGEFGLRNKREVWRVKLVLAKIRKAARQLLTLEEKDPKRLFEGNALLRRLIRIGVLDGQRHIRVRKQVVDVPSFVVRLDSQKHIDFSLKSPLAGGRPGRVARKNKGKKGGDDDD